MKTSRLAVQGTLIGIGIYLYSCVALTAFQSLQYLSVIIWMPILIVLGFVIHRRWWPTHTDAWKAVGFSLLSFCAVMALIGLLLTGGWDSQWIEYYGLWFWLPFLVGIALGGVRFRKHPAAVQDH